MERWRNFHHPISLTSGPVISATRHEELRLGQRVDDPARISGVVLSNQTSSRPQRATRSKGFAKEKAKDVKNPKQERKRKATPETAKKQSGKNQTTEGAGGSNVKKQKVQLAPSPSIGPAPVRPSRKPAGGQLKKHGPLQIKDLVDGQIITPGVNKVSVHYKGATYKADLSKEGTIIYAGRQFHAASAFSVHVKRLLTPNKQGDDGWKSVHVDGKPLEEWRADYFEKQLHRQKPGGKTSSEGVACANGGKRGGRKEKGGRRQSSKQLAAAEPLPQEDAFATDNGIAEVATDHWVQCSRCEVWRVVMPEFWEIVQSDTREEWFCEDADWDITECHPYTKACSG
ncbi:hypothetical protein BSKO_01226 [Bryopsis sp. KO-2023]|nr:hypothetical protein BSKO_01226 [Bryopsis sp. KO-2023]